MRRRLLSAVRIIVIAYIGMILYAFLIADSMIFQPQPASYSDTPQIIKLTSSADVAISAVFLEKTNSEFTVLFSHGNAEDLGWVIPFLQQYRDHGFSVFAYDYRGYGTSEGEPSVTGTYEDIHTAYEYMVEELGISSEKIIVHGRSIGSGPSTWLASREKVGGLILESAFVSAFRVQTVVQLVPFDKYPNLQNLESIHCPLLIIHGERDNVIPFWHGERLFAEAREPKAKYFVELAGHNDLGLVAGEEYWENLSDFASKYLRSAD